MIIVQFFKGADVVSTIELDLLIITTTPKYFETGNPYYSMQVTVRFLGAHKVIEFKQVWKSDIVREGQKTGLLDLRFSLNVLSVSVMYLRKKDPRRELAHVYFSNIMGMVEVRENSSITFAGFVEHFQIDNNSHIKTAYPVVVRKCEDRIRKSVQKKKFLEWSVSLEDPSKSNHLYISNVLLSLGNLEILLEEEYLDLLKEYVGDISERIQQEKETKTFDFAKKKYFDRPEEHGFDRSLLLWQFTSIDVHNNYVYIDNLSLPHLKVLVSYFQNASSTMEKDFELVSLVGVAVGGFENALLEMKGLHKEYPRLTQQPLPALRHHPGRHHELLPRAGAQSSLLDHRLAEHPGQSLQNRQGVLRRHRQPPRQPRRRLRQGHRRRGRCHRQEQHGRVLSAHPASSEA